MDSVEYARGHDQLEPVRNVHAPLLRKSDAGHAASVRLAAPYTEEKMPLFTVTKLQVKLLGSVGMLNLHRYMMWRMGRIGSSGKQKARKRVHKRQYGGPAFLHDDRCDRFGLHELMLPTHLSLKRACSLYLQPRMRDFHVR
jgi:hypothetical protein